MEEHGTAPLIITDEHPGWFGVFGLLINEEHVAQGDLEVDEPVRTYIPASIR